MFLDYSIHRDNFIIWLSDRNYNERYKKNIISYLDKYLLGNIIYSPADVSKIWMMSTSKKERKRKLHPEHYVKFTKIMNKKIGELRFEDFDEILTAGPQSEPIKVYDAEVYSENLMGPHAHSI